MRPFRFFVLCLLCLGVAGYAWVIYGTRPLGSGVHPDMQTVFQTHRWGIYAHIFASSLTLLLGPWQFLPRLRTKYPGLHRLFGKTYLGLGVGLGGIAGLYMAPYVYGGLVSTTGFGLLALLWLFTGFQAYRMVRQRNFLSHQKWMIRNFSLSLAAVTLRLYLGAGFAIGLPFELFYPYLAWLSWVPNILAAEYLVRIGKMETVIAP